MTATAQPVSVAEQPEREERPVREGPERHIVAALVRKELRDSVRDRWFWLYVGAFVVLAVAITSITFSERRDIGFQGFGRSAASLVTLVQLVVPLMGLTLGARSVAGQRERGSLAFLLSHPISRTEAFLGILLGNAAAMAAAIAAGFGVAGFISAIRSTDVAAGDLLAITLLAWLLAVAMVAIGMVISVSSRRSATAMGTALFAWLLLVVIGDLGLMGTAVATRLPVSALFFSAVANPVEAFRLTAMSIMHGSLDVLGPVGNYSVDRFGGSVKWVTGVTLVVWAVVPSLVALLVFRRGRDL